MCIHLDVKFFILKCDITEFKMLSLVLSLSQIYIYIFQNVLRNTILFSSNHDVWLNWWWFFFSENCQRLLNHDQLKRGLEKLWTSVSWSLNLFKCSAVSFLQIRKWLMLYHFANTSCYFLLKTSDEDLQLNFVLVESRKTLAITKALACIHIWSGVGCFLMIHSSFDQSTSMYPQLARSRVLSNDSLFLWSASLRQ